VNELGSLVLRLLVVTNTDADVTRKREYLVRGLPQKELNNSDVRLCSEAQSKALAKTVEGMLDGNRFRWDCIERPAVETGLYMGDEHVEAESNPVHLLGNCSSLKRCKSRAIFYHRPNLPATR